ncbi:MAG TPA: hypothetical protein VK541_23035 [Pedobacter sp.]|uniref:tellurite resistance TerB family protein n=1 Tax=Pedobacter sp. TaxID=1411316 RepID=UPI002D0799BE|nr:hypothetical protein [Pedobacter sp.]HMI05383.1 hypothetical protein [Pedobacter sp.]
MFNFERQRVIASIKNFGLLMHGASIFAEQQNIIVLQIGKTFFTRGSLIEFKVTDINDNQSMVSATSVSGSKAEQNIKIIFDLVETQLNKAKSKTVSKPEEIDFSNFSKEDRPIPNSNKLSITVQDHEIYEPISIPEDIEGIPLNILVHINYVDASGLKSSRRITIYYMYNEYKDISLHSFCHERREDRTFKLSRITQMTDIETGEIIKNYSGYFTDRFNDTPIGKLTRMFIQMKPEISILIFMARADGFLRKPERDIIREFIDQHSETQLDSDLLDNEIRITNCTNKEFRSALKKVSIYDAEIRRSIYDRALQIIATDKKTDPMEVAALELIKKIK